LVPKEKNSTTRAMRSATKQARGLGAGVVDAPLDALAQDLDLLVGGRAGS
jgi:hypothetical protein